MNDILKEAESFFKQGFNCCQSILGAFGPKFGLDKNQCLKLCTGFAGGMSYQGKTCGAVIGSYLIIGLINGSHLANDELKKDKTYMLINEFNKQFLNKYKSTNCKDILGAEIYTEEGMATISENKLFESICPSVVKYSAEILHELLNQRKEK